MTVQNASGEYARSIQAAGDAGYRNGNIPTGSWTYIDTRAGTGGLVDPGGRYIHVTATNNDIYVCMVATASVTPSISNTTNFEANVAEYLFAGKEKPFVINNAKPFLALRAVTSAANVEAHIK